VHPVQYLFTGIAMVFFYVLLLSLAEHLGSSRLPGGRRCHRCDARHLRRRRPVERGPRLVMLVVFALTYAMLYLILQLEDYALLAGAILGFVALAIVMFVTLRVDWSGSARQAAS
jgi:inner membrane protein